MKTPTCGIIGPGPLGLALAHRLTKAGVRTALFSRLGPMASETQADGERLVTASHALRDCGLILSAVPAHAVEEAFAIHAPAVTPGTPWINLSNGMVWDTLEACGRSHPNVLARAGIVQFGAREDAGAIVTTGATDVRWGPLLPSPMTEAEGALTRISGWRWDADVKKRLILKWIYNSVLNSLCAAKGWRTNGEALAQWFLVTPLVAEAVALAKELWNASFDAAEVEVGLQALVQKTAGNENSMARALRRGVKTEHDALLGWVHRSHGPYPSLRALAQELESKRV